VCESVVVWDWFKVCFDGKNVRKRENGTQPPMAGDFKLFLVIHSLLTTRWCGFREDDHKIL
jgi:hypothetical protein